MALGPFGFYEILGRNYKGVCTVTEPHPFSFQLLKKTHNSTWK